MDKNLLTDHSCEISSTTIAFKHFFYLIIGILALAFARGAGAESIALQWNPVVDDPLVIGYEVHYGMESGQYLWVIDADTNGAATDTQLVENLVAGNTYYFAVRSHNHDDSLVSGFSNEVFATIASSDTTSDAIPPTVSISTTPEGPTYTSAQTVTIGADASDNIGVTRVEFYDGATLKGTDTIAPYSYAWSISSVYNGIHDWTARAYDAAGNVSTTGVLIRTVDIPYDPLAGLTAAYGMEETEGTTITDASGNSNDGLIVGAIRIADGRFGSAVSFDGVDDRIDLNTLDIVGGDGLTISAWMKADDFGIYDARLISKATGVNENDHYWMISTFENNSLRFRLKAGGSTTTLISNGGVITTGLWHHVAATYDGVRMRLYVDGVEVGSFAKTGLIDTNASVPAAIGNQPQGARPFDGSIDEVRLYTHSLSAEEIKADMGVPISTTIVPSDTIPPNVSVSTSPEGPTYTSAQTVTVSAEASDNVGVTRVEFYDGTTLKGTDTIAPYSYAWTIGSVDNGSHTWTAKAYDAADNVSTSDALIRTVSILLPDTMPPTVSISTTPEGPTYTSAQTVTVGADASDNVGVTRVEFYDGLVLKGTDSIAPYSYAWEISSAENGTHSWTAKAYDAANNLSTSAVLSRTVSITLVDTDTTPPAVSIGSIPEGPIYTSAQTVTISATASDNVGVTRVEFYEGTTLKGTDTTAPYSYAWSISRADNGIYSWTARAYDASNNVSTTSALSRTVNISGGGRVATYDFEETESAIVIDVSGNGNHGLITEGTRTTDGRFGSAVSFDGVNDSVDLNTLDITGGDGLTISAWMKADDFGTYDARLVSKATGVNEQDHYWMVSTFSKNSVRFRLKAGGLTTTLIGDSGVIAAGQWQHVTATYDGQFMRLYVDGVEVGSALKTGVIDTNNQVPVAIGNQPQGSKPFDGSIDEVRIYNRALIEEEIQADMTSPISATSTSTDTMLTVSKSGTGSGMVDSYPIGVSCGDDCDELYTYGTVVTLTATPDTGSNFVGWSGDADCADGQVTMDVATACTASFNDTTGEVLAYGFEEVEGAVVLDTSGNGYDGLIVGATRSTDGRFGSAVAFDGVDDWVDLSTLDIDGEGLTISVWMKADDFGTYDARLVSKATGVNENDHYWMVSTFRNNSVRFRLKAGGSTTTLISNSGVITAGQWHHVAATYDGLRMRLYVDGVEVSSTAKSGAIDTNASVPAAIGNQPQGVRPFDGLIDEVRFYNRALVAEEIQVGMVSPIGDANVAVAKSLIQQVPLTAVPSRVLNNSEVDSLTQTGQDSGNAFSYEAFLTRLSEFGASVPDFELNEDGSVVAFATTAALVASDVNGLSDVYLYDVLYDEFVLVSRDMLGHSGNGSSQLPSIDNLGERVVFESDAEDLLENDRNGVTDVYLYDRVLDQVQRASVTETGDESSYPARNPVIGGEGRRVVFDREDSVGLRQIQVYDVDLSYLEPEPLSFVQDDHGNLLDSHHPAISRDGNYIAYIEVQGPTEEASDTCFVQMYSVPEDRYESTPCPTGVESNSDVALSFVEDDQWLSLSVAEDDSLYKDPQVLYLPNVVWTMESQ